MMMKRAVLESLTLLWLLVSFSNAFNNLHNKRRLFFNGVFRNYVTKTRRTISQKKTILYNRFSDSQFDFASPERDDDDNDRIVTKTKTRKVKHRNRTSNSNKRKKRTKKQIRKELVRAFTEDVTERHDIANNIAKEYVRGVKGIRASAARRKMIERDAAASEELRKQTNYLKMLERHPALVLNADYQPLNYLPLSIWTWQEAVKAVFNGKVTVVDVYPDVNIRAVNLEIPLPSVIVLNEYVSQINKQRPAFTRRNVFLRDGYRCQYCNDIFRTSDLSLDHVLPRCMGGKLRWDNAVTCCKSCNSRKGSLPISEIKSVGMRLVREPRMPTAFELASEAGKLVPRKVHPTWTPFLGEGYVPATNSEQVFTFGDYEH
mmetsp:Transcript_58764/g.70072  ORF Transcript_58764/g.70072 Transcript_58764/m.70072 type:complete len:374 (-) Transcript_58764:119-1240(-)|eukprot:CAMPEP_0172495318 /NCGR_PEP_ID=MMETSP1066-20121228/67587_1 /TAXON_ID=671091 /ORGANISM="Coscinodiscus wailesii, Strain CCMP2513" /LENGTH=373 /DNA_ID=CAMNT_0013266897 /DNA_START=178 /DNA_END=1299 /DNA_ORIENTATION=+